MLIIYILIFFILLFLILFILILPIYIMDLKYVVYKFNYYLNNYIPLYIDNNKLPTINIKEKKNKILIISFDNRPETGYLRIHNENVKNYCDKWGYEYIYVNKSKHNIYWARMYLIIDALKKKNYDYVMWMDTDTIFVDQDISLDSILNKYSSDIYIGYDDPNVSLSPVLCNGVFIVKNSPIGLEIIHESIDSYEKNLEICTYYVNDKIQLKGIWAGLCFEQGKLNDLFLTKYKQNFTILDTNIISNTSSCIHDTFILHFYGKKDGIVKCFEDVLQGN